jgi:SAM-dependent methyltransferase
MFAGRRPVRTPGGSVRPEWLTLLRCPDDGVSPLVLYPVSVQGDGTIVEGGLECTTCHRLFPIRDAIASLMPSALVDAEHDREMEGLAARIAQAERAAREQGDRLPVEDMLSEIRARDREVSDYEARYHSGWQRFEIETCLSRLEPESHETILDAGCGTGRMTRAYLGRARLVVGADYSLESLRHLARSVDPALRQRLFLVRCELGHLPFAEDVFDGALSTSVLSNVPTAETRSAGLDQIHRVLAPGGRVLITVYHHCWVKRVRQRLGLSSNGRKQGYHSDGAIHYYNFDPDELLRWASERFVTDSCFGLEHRIPVLSRLSPGIAGAIDRTLARTPLSLRLFAAEIGTLARKPAR